MSKSFQVADFGPLVSTASEPLFDGSTGQTIVWSQPQIRQSDCPTYKTEQQRKDWAYSAPFHQLSHTRFVPSQSKRHDKIEECINQLFLKMSVVEQDAECYLSERTRHISIHIEKALKAFSPSNQGLKWHAAEGPSPSWYDQRYLGNLGDWWCRAHELITKFFSQFCLNMFS